MTEVLEKQTELEAVGPAFLKDKMLEMRAKTRNTIHAIAAAASRAWWKRMPWPWPRIFLPRATWCVAGMMSTCASEPIR